MSITQGKKAALKNWRQRWGEDQENAQLTWSPCPAEPQEPAEGWQSWTVQGVVMSLINNNRDTSAEISEQGQAENEGFRVGQVTWGALLLL